jgi:proteasome lid subunit RPN8/RPN11
VKIRRGDVETILAHARSGYPFEVCGVLLGPASTPVDVLRVTEVMAVVNRAVRVTEVVPVDNRETEMPRVRYQIAPEDLIHIQRTSRERGLDIVGFYHSHPDHPARPSETDRRIAAEGLSDGVVHVVVGVAGGVDAVPTAWIFRDARQGFDEEPFEVE